jgi:hypothetical protein
MNINEGEGVPVHNMMVYGGWQEVYFYSLLTSTLDRDERANSCPGVSILGGITPCSF